MNFVSNVTSSDKFGQFKITEPIQKWLAKTVEKVSLFIVISRENISFKWKKTWRQVNVYMAFCNYLSCNYTCGFTRVD